MVALGLASCVNYGGASKLYSTSDGHQMFLLEEGGGVGHPLQGRNDFGGISKDTPMLKSESILRGLRVSRII